MKVRQIMTPRPLTVRPGDPPAELARLMEAAQVHHVPEVEAGRLVGLWLSTPEGPMVLLGPERVHGTTPDADADEAIAALLAGSEAAIAWEDGEPVGLLTRADVMRIVRFALARGIGQRTSRPVVLRLVGPAGAGKTTLVIRTLQRLRRLRTAVVQANSAVPAGGADARIEGAPVVDAPEAHWRRGLRDAMEGLRDAQLVIVEDRDGPPVVTPGVGGDLQVLVVPPEGIGDLSEASLREAQAVVVTRLDEAPAGFDAGRARDALCAANPRLAVFGVAAAHDDRGLDEWAAWIERRVLPRGH